MYYQTIFRSLRRALLHPFSGTIFSPLGAGTAASAPYPEPHYAPGQLGRTSLLLGLVLGIFLALGVGSAPAEARVQAKVSDIHYSNCPPELAHNLVLGGGVMSANCFLIQGTVHNDSGKVLLNADVFGRIYDANGNDAMPERGRLGSVDSVPLGDSSFEIMVTVPADQPEPLTLKQFKISGFTGKVRR